MTRCALHDAVVPSKELAPEQLFNALLSAGHRISDLFQVHGTTKARPTSVEYVGAAALREKRLKGGFNVKGDPHVVGWPVEALGACRVAHGDGGLRRDEETHQVLNVHRTFADQLLLLRATQVIQLITTTSTFSPSRIPTPLSSISCVLIFLVVTIFIILVYRTIPNIPQYIVTLPWNSSTARSVSTTTAPRPVATASTPRRGATTTSSANLCICSRSSASPKSG